MGCSDSKKPSPNKRNKRICKILHARGERTGCITRAKEIPILGIAGVMNLSQVTIIRKPYHVVICPYYGNLYHFLQQPSLKRRPA